MKIAVATWNVHAGVGLDRRYDAARIARVIGDLGADVVALQEMLFGGSRDLGGFLERELGGHLLRAPTHARGSGSFGNALWSRFSIRHPIVHNLTIEGREPRNLLDASLDCDGEALRVLATHLGLNRHERSRQFERVLEIARTPAQPAQSTILLGDFNEARQRSAALRAVHAAFGGATSSPRTFPSLFPALALDRIWMIPADKLLERSVQRTRRARLASDHLPLRALIAI